MRFHVRNGAFRQKKTRVACSTSKLGKFVSLARETRFLSFSSFVSLAHLTSFILPFNCTCFLFWPFSLVWAFLFSASSFCCFRLFCSFTRRVTHCVKFSLFAEEKIEIQVFCESFSEASRK